MAWRTPRQLMRLPAAILLTAMMWTWASARPLFFGESRLGNACLKGQLGHPAVFSADLPPQLRGRSYFKPDFIDWPLDYRAWEKEHLKYFKKTYGESSLTFKPSMIVMHFTVVPTAEQTYAVLQRRKVSVHLMVDRDGSTYQLMPFNRRCNGAYGVNHKALSIEMVATSESDLLSHPQQLFQSFCCVKYLCAKYDIPPEKVVGHYEVGMGVTRVPEYLDMADPYYPTRYPPNEKRTDPGETYMRWLRAYLKADPPTGCDL